MKLYLGVNDVPEPESELTTYPVAVILEEKYELFSKFADTNTQAIANHLATYFSGETDNILRGNPIKERHYIDEISQDFRNFIDSEEMAKLGVAGVPTKAALTGYSRRLKKRTGKRRPSFIDTGILQKSLLTWVE